MMIRLLPLILAMPLNLAAAEAVPHFDIDPVCRGVDTAAVAPGRTAETCKNDERVALDTLNQTWTQFQPADQQTCTSLSRTGGPPSYVELLTCLEMARDAKNLPKQLKEPSTTVPSAAH